LRWSDGSSTENTFESNPTLADELRALGIAELVACGIQSECCVQSTSIGALSEGFKVTILEGAHGTYPSGNKSAEDVAVEAQKVVETAGARVVKWEEWRP
jgi:nicotinamidase-related amidase